MGRSIRQILKAQTATQHDALDRRVSPLIDGGRADYIRFLRIQYAARYPLEQWIAADLPRCAPPIQTPLIAADLGSLDETLPFVDDSFDPGPDAPSLGLKWLLAGSSLGNRMLHRRVLGRSADLPAAFLGDPRMLLYWRSLQPQLEHVPSAEDAQRHVAVAKAAFSLFLSVAERETARETA